MYMVRFLFLCAMLAMVAACSDAPEYDAPARQAPALWMVEDAETGAKGYLMGSVHMLPDGLDWVTPDIRAAAASSNVLITEIGDGAAPDGLFDTMGSDEKVPALERRLDKAAFARAELLASGAGLTEGDLDTTESWAAAILLSQAQSADLGITTHNGAETQLRLLMEGKQVQGLETAGSQLQRFDDLATATQDTMLRLSLSAADPRADFQAMLTAWLSGDLQALTAVSDKGMMADPALRAALLDAPNAQWAKVIAAHIRAGERPFIAIGSAHVLGEDSVLAHLARQGFIITRVQ